MPLENLRAGADTNNGDRLGTTTYTSEQTYSSTQTVTDKTFTKPSVADGNPAVTVSGGTVTFEYCTFTNIGTSAGYTGGGYRFGLIDLTSGATSVVFNNCVFDGFGSIAAQGNRNNMMHVNCPLTMYNCRITNVYSDQSLPNYTSGDEGNRCIWCNSAADNLDVTYCTFDNPGRNVLQISNSSTMSGSQFSHNVVFGSTHNDSEFEDMINLYLAGGTSTNDRLEIKSNYLANGGPSSSGTAIIAGDGNGSTNLNWVEVDNNYVVNPGNVGIAMYGGSNSFQTNNKVYATEGSTSQSVGMYTADFNNTNSSVGTPAMDSNTVSNNRVYFIKTPPSTTSHFWDGSPDKTTYTNHTSTGNVYGDTSLNFTNMRDIDCSNDSLTVAAGSPISTFNLFDTDTSYFRDDTYAVVSGTMPAGLTLNSDGTITGTPTAPGSSTVTYQATNRWGLTDTANINLTVTGGTVTLFEITMPADDAIDVDTPITISGTAPNDGNNDSIIVRVYDVTNATILSNWGDINVTYNAGAETWSADEVVTIPQLGEEIQVKARRY